MSGPQRVQLRRTKGWRKPVDAVVVARPSRWGNPFRVVKRPAGQGPFPWVVTSSFRDHILGAHGTRAEAAEQAVEVYELQLGPEGTLGISHAEIWRELHGHDLACWCPPSLPCHADVLLAIANGPVPEHEHAQRYDGDDPYLVCWCGARWDALTGRQIT